FARTGARYRLLRDRVAGDRVASVDGHPRKPIPRGPLRYKVDGVLLAERGRDGKAVVLADEDLGQLVDRGEVESFVRVAFGARALAIAGHERVVGGGQRERGGDAGAA